jgi:uncharacterized protein
MTAVVKRTCLISRPLRGLNVTLQAELTNHRDGFTSRFNARLQFINPKWMVLLLLLVTASGEAATPLPPLDCQQSHPSAVEKLICQDPELATLEQEMMTLYLQLLPQAALQKPFLLNAEQRGWQKGRNDCWKEPAIKSCVVAQYQRRTAELQARYRLVEESEPMAWRCQPLSSDPLRNDSSAEALRLTLFKTMPETILTEYANEKSLMFLETSEPTRLFVGRNERLEFRGEDALLQWGYQSSLLLCKPLPFNDKKVQRQADHSQQTV